MGIFSHNCGWCSADIAEIKQALGQLQSMLLVLMKGNDTMALDLTKLTATVAKQTTVEQSALTLITGLSANLAAIAKQLAAAIAANDPVAQAAAQAQLDALQATLDNNDEELAAAIAANTPAAGAGGS